MPFHTASARQVLLFSQWTMTLDLLEWYMGTKGFSYVRLDGNTQVGAGAIQRRDKGSAFTPHCPPCSLPCSPCPPHPLPSSLPPPQVADRLAIVDRFNDPSQGIFCFLLSTRAGGQGLNLTGADVVVLHDVDFNPQVDRQAEDRCHRWEPRGCTRRRGCGGVLWAEVGSRQLGAVFARGFPGGVAGVTVQTP